MSAQRTIGVLAREAGVHVETIRYYERRGLLERPPRSAGGARTYPAETVQRLRFIRRAQHMGFTLREVAALLALGDGACDDVRTLSRDKLTEVRGRIRDLRRLEGALARLVAACEQNGDPTHCPIVAALDSPEAPGA